jgi:hypothetical protein
MSPAFILLLCLLGICVASPLAIVSLKDQWREGGVMENADFAYSMGFNAVFVPLQKTRDEYPRLVVSSNPEISKFTMLEYHQNAPHRSSYSPLLGEFLGNTANTIKTLLIPIQTPDDVDTIVHELSLSPRSSNTFVLVVPHDLVAMQPNQDDAISRYRSLVPDGDIILYKEDFQGREDECTKLIHQLHALEISKLAVPATSIGKEIVQMAHFNNITVGAFYADSKELIRDVSDLGVDFFTTQEPLNYLSFSSKKMYKHVNKAHAAVVFG